VREIFSVRFFIAIGAVAGLLFLLFTFFVARDVVDQAIGGNGGDATQPQVHAIDLVDVVTSTDNPGFQVSADGVAASNAEFVLDPTRKVTVVAGTPGEDDCGRLAEPGACAIVADLLGEGVVWFALVPMGTGRTVPLPAIDSLADGSATLVNGWQLPHAPALDRRCGDELFESYRQWKQILGDNFTTIYDIDQRELTAVVCREVVPYGPPPASTLAPPPPTPVPTSTPAVSAPVTTVGG
jgi:hypothetical protein